MFFSCCSCCHGTVKKRSNCGARLLLRALQQTRGRRNRPENLFISTNIENVSFTSTAAPAIEDKRRNQSAFIRKRKGANIFYCAFSIEAVAAASQRDIDYFSLILDDMMYQLNQMKQQTSKILDEGTNTQYLQT